MNFFALTVTKFNFPIHAYIEGFVKHIIGKRIGMFFFGNVEHIGRQTKVVEIAACPDTRKEFSRLMNMHAAPMECLRNGMQDGLG
jgi:hypothetical protein